MSITLVRRVGSVCFGSLALVLLIAATGCQGPAGPPGPARALRAHPQAVGRRTFGSAHPRILRVAALPLVTFMSSTQVPRPQTSQ